MTDRLIRMGSLAILLKRRLKKPSLWFVLLLGLITLRLVGTAVLPDASNTEVGLMDSGGVYASAITKELLGGRSVYRYRLVSFWTAGWIRRRSPAISPPARTQSSPPPRPRRRRSRKRFSRSFSRNIRTSSFPTSVTGGRSSRRTQRRQSRRCLSPAGVSPPATRCCRSSSRTPAPAN